MRQSAKQKVKAIYPTATLVQDMNATVGFYKSKWANEAVFSIGLYRDGTVIEDEIFKTLYQTLVENTNWEFLSGWKDTPTKAWNAAWKSIENEMMKKLEQ